MQLIKPVTFTTSMLVSTNATETVAAWNSATTYAKDAEVNFNNSIYVSLQASNTNRNPGTEPTWWLRKSANNTYSMFDEFVNTQTTRTGDLTVTINPGQIVNSLAILNVDGATSLRVQATDGAGGPVVFDQTYNMDDTIITDWYMYFFEPYDLKDQFIVTGIPPYTNIRLIVTISTNSTVRVGNLVFGNMYDIGLTQEGASAGIRDYSVKQVNAFGITTFVQRAFSKRMDCNVYVDRGQLNFVQKILTELRATPIVWIGTESDDYRNLTVFGYYRDFNIEISYPTYCLCRLEIEGLV